MEKEYMNTTDNQTGLGVDYCIGFMNETLQKAAGMVVYSSQVEKNVSLVVIVAICIFTLIGQFSVIITIALSENLRQMSHFIVILTYCVADLVMVVAVTPMYVWQYAFGCIPLLPCRTFSHLTIVPGFGIGNWIGYMALERAVYFCYPMHYERLFTTRKLVAAICIIFGMSWSYTLITDVVIGRGYHATVLACNLPSSGSQTIVQLLLFIVPATVITVVCVVKIWRLSNACSVAPVRLNLQPSTSTPQSAPSTNITSVGSTRPIADEANDPSVLTTCPERSDCQPACRSGDTRVPTVEQTSAGPAVIPCPGPATGDQPPIIPFLQAKKAFRMIVLVSGAFWGTILPAYVIRTAIFMGGHSWIGLDTRDHATQAIMLRLGNYSYSCVSSFLNPIIYFYSRRDLRRAFWKLLGIRSNAVGP